MAQLNFPDPAVTQTYTEAGITWTWNATLGVWSAEPGSGGGDFTQAEADGRYLRVDADSPNQTRVAGEANFAELTTHDGGVKVAGGDVTAISTGLYSAGVNNDLRVAINNTNTLRFTDQESILNALARGSNLTSGNLRILFANFLATDFTGRTDVNAVYTKFESAVDGTGTCDSFHGFRVDRGTNGVGFATDAYGFYSELNTDSSTGETYNFYAEGTAPNYFAGLTEHASGVSTGTVSNGTTSITLNENNPANFSFTSSTSAQGGTQCQGALFTFATSSSFSKPVYGVHSYMGVQGFSSSERVSSFYTALSDATNISSSEFVAGYISQVQPDSNQGTGGNYNFYAEGDAPSYMAGGLRVGDNPIYNPTGSAAESGMRLNKTDISIGRNCTSNSHSTIYCNLTGVATTSFALKLGIEVLLLLTPALGAMATPGKQITLQLSAALQELRQYLQPSLVHLQLLQHLAQVLMALVHKI